MQEYLQFAQNHLMLVGGFVAVLALIIWNEFQNLTKKYKDINTKELVRLMNDGAPLLIDVRDPSETKDGVIKGARQIPLNEVSKRLGDLEKNKNSAVVVYCRSGNRSSHAAATLTKNGFAEVYNLQGGIVSWQSDNLPLARR